MSDDLFREAKESNKNNFIKNQWTIHVNAAISSVAWNRREKREFILLLWKTDKLVSIESEEVCVASECVEFLKNKQQNTLC